LTKLILIGLGGFLGAAMRYLTGTFIQQILGEELFPYGTFAVNLFGSLLIGFLITLAGTEGLLSPTAQLFLITGMLGAFTTFSTFSYETWQLFQQGRAAPALMNMGVHLFFGLAAVWAGGWLARLWQG